jgi:hypothetical protein
MFAYFTKINNKEILYFNEDDSNDDEYLFNKQTIANWANEYNIKLVSFIPQDEIVVNEDIPPLFSYS